MTDIADLGFKVDTSGIDRANDSLDGLDKKGEKVSGKLSKSFKTMAKVGGAAVLALGAAASKSIDSLDKIGKTADKVGLSTDSLQELRHAADLTGISTQTLDTAMQRFARRSGEAAEGTGTLSKIFDELGISATNADGSIKGTEELLNEFGDALGNVDSESERLRLSMAAFDTEGAALGQLFKDGSEGAQVLRDSMQNVIPRSAIDDASAAKDAMTNLGTATTNLANAFLSQLSPYIAAAADWLANDLPSAIGSAQDALTDGIEATVNFGEAIKEMATDSVKFVVDMVSGIKDALIGTFTGIVDKAGELVGDVTGFFADMYDKVVGNSYVPDMIDRIGDEFGTLDTVMVEPSKTATEEVNEQFESMKDSVSDSLADAVISGGSFSDSIKGIFNGLLGDLKSFISSWASSGISKLFSSVFSGGFDTSGFGFGGGGGLTSLASTASTASAGITKLATAYKTYIAGAKAAAAGTEVVVTGMEAMAPAAEAAEFSSLQAGNAAQGASAGYAAFGAAAGVAIIAMIAHSSHAKRASEVTAEVSAKMKEAEITISNSSVTFGKWGEEGVGMLNTALSQSGTLNHAMRTLGANVEYVRGGALLVKAGFDEANIAATAFTDETSTELGQMVDDLREVEVSHASYALRVGEAQREVGKSWGESLEIINSTNFDNVIAAFDSIGVTAAGVFEDISSDGIISADEIKAHFGASADSIITEMSGASSITVAELFNILGVSESVTNGLSSDFATASDAAAREWGAGTEEIQRAINSLEGTSVTSTHNIEVTRSYNGDGGGGKALGTGGKFETVPSGYPNDSYPIFLQSGEDYMVRTPADRAAAKSVQSESTSVDGGGDNKVVVRLDTLIAQNAKIQARLSGVENAVYLTGTDTVNVLDDQLRDAQANR